MQVILLERIGHLGQMGDVVNVKNGYARNYLLPQKKALRATDDNKKLFETQRVQLEANNLERKTEAEPIGEKLSGKSFIAIRQAGDTGQLYGSVSTRDIAEAITAGGFSIERRQIVLNTADQGTRRARGRRQPAPGSAASRSRSTSPAPQTKPNVRPR